MSRTRKKQHRQKRKKEKNRPLCIILFSFSGFPAFFPVCLPFLFRPPRANQTESASLKATRCNPKAMLPSFFSRPRPTPHFTQAWRRRKDTRRNNRRFPQKKEANKKELTQKRRRVMSILWSRNPIYLLCLSDCSFQKEIYVGREVEWKIFIFRHSIIPVRL